MKNQLIKELKEGIDLLYKQAEEAQTRADKAMDLALTLTRRIWELEAALNVGNEEHDQDVPGDCVVERYDEERGEWRYYRLRWNSNVSRYEQLHETDNLGTKLED